MVMSSSNKLQLLVSFIVKSIPTVTEKSSPVSSMLSNGIKDVVKEGENGFITREGMQNRRLTAFES